ncbi:glycoside hydrolase family 43 protein [Dyadobacter fanqingshengii]|uniref:Glycoside hydrolase family 43 protein n=1 Tax=Dyadobacter fanqingshengii TaxID=2906443 RepID=A0A9X1PFW8_9BACT|nr:glycoside hydrolase family 43 protein [Dyadobacter fanqingshengii]MCF0043080.1 glycoside hydrolase family 43 protein [Dyadobacter fanqingshengii]USJ35633.1 glycoside hydrolase family 43 protein [Dyadobacter fanqingshengii]
MKSFTIFFLTFLFITHAFAQKPKPKPAPGLVVTYKNPVIAGDFADPSVILVGDTYYAAGTSSEWGPAYPIYSSKNLVDWEYVGPVFADLPEWTMGSFWAPELYFRNGTFYCYYTARRKSDKQSFIGVASTKDLKEGFTDHGVIIEWTKEAIDAFVVEDNGKLFITWKAYGLDKDRGIEILGAELAPDGLKVIGKEFSLIKAEPTGWESGGAEGQSIFKRGNYWYMLYSGNACCGANCDYQVGFARAEKLEGPWTKYAGNPSLFGDDSWKCPGHGTVVVTPDNRYFYLHHAYNGIDFTFAGRQGVLSELVWDEVSKWPAFRYGKTTPAQAEAPIGIGAVVNHNFSINYNKDTLKAPWVYDVSFPKPAFEVQNGALEIENTNRINTGNFLGLTVKKGSYTFTVEVTAKKDLSQNIIVYGDAKNAIGYGIRDNHISLWQVKDGVHEVIKTQEIPDKYKDIKLSLQSRYGRFYEFRWDVKGQKIDSLTSSVQIETPWLPRWDRAPRVGVNVSGNGSGKSEIKAVQMKYD